MSFYNNLKYFKKNIALVLDNEEVTYNDLLQKALQISNQFKNNSLIFLLIDNDLESLSALIGSNLNNSVAMLLNSNINSKSLSGLIKLYHPDYIFFNKSTKIKLDNYENEFSFYNYVLLKSKESIKKNLYSDLFLLQSTSGSTGSPKNVRLSYKNLISNTNSIINDLKIVENDIAITTLPLSYVYGLSIVNTHLNIGAKIVLNKNSIIEKKFWSKLLFNKVNNFGGVPYTYEILMRMGLKDEYFKFLKYSTIAGGHLNSQLKSKILDFYEKNNILLISMYGAAEATARMSYLPSNFSRKKIDSIGIAISNGSFYLEDENNNVISDDNKDGELIFKGENVCMGYAYSFKDLSKKDENNSILRTKDIGYFDSEGFYYVKGKKSRYVKLVGNRVSLDELEKIIFEYGFENVCVQFNKDELCIFLKERNFEKDVKSYISKYTNLHEKLFRIQYIDEFPMTQNNKIDYNSDIFKNND